MKKEIKIAYVDFWNGFKPDSFFITKTISKKYKVIIDNENPDFVICGTFGNTFLSYDCPRILYTGEANCPDFNIYDYAIGFERMVYEDRYLRYPLFLVNEDLLQDALNKHKKSDDYYLRRDGFCSFVVSASGGMDGLRNWYFDKISEYKQVASGGRFRNNLPDGKPVPDKKAFQENYRFSLCFENAGISGYATEKIVDAFAAGCIPIYYGDTNIEKDFNPKSFIHVKSREDLDSVLAWVKELEENQNKYLEVIRQPAILPDSPIMGMLNNTYIEEFLFHIFDQEPQEAIRRHSKLTMWGQFYEYRLKKWNKIENNMFLKKARSIKRKYFGLKKIVK